MQVYLSPFLFELHTKFYNKTKSASTTQYTNIEDALSVKLSIKTQELIPVQVLLCEILTTLMYSEMFVGANFVFPPSIHPSIQFTFPHTTITTFECFQKVIPDAMSVESSFSSKLYPALSDT